MAPPPSDDAPPPPGLDPELARELGDEDPPTAEELAAAAELRQAIEGGAWTPPVAPLQPPAELLRRSAAPVLSELDHQRMRRRLQDGGLPLGLPSRGAAAASAGGGGGTVRRLFSRPLGRVMALAASLVLVVGTGVLVKRYLPSTGGGPAPLQPYAQVFTAPFDRQGSAIDRLDRMIAWREGRLAGRTALGPGARAEVQR
jgi:hypothetical protein